MTANIRHSSENPEFMSPEWLTEMSRFVMGGHIPLDPASTHFANRTIRAERFYTKKQNGLFLPWDDWFYTNPPGGLVDATGREVIRATKTRRGCTETGACGLPPGHKHVDVNSSAAFWWAKAMYEFTSGRCPGGIFLGFSLELLGTAQKFECRQPLTFPNCVPKQRICFEYEVEDKRVPAEDPTHTNIIIFVHKYLGQFDTSHPWVERFIETFSQIGSVHVPRGY